MASQRIPSITMTRVLIVVLALLAAGLAMWRVSTTAPAPDAPYFPPGHMQITANNRNNAPPESDKPAEGGGSVPVTVSGTPPAANPTPTTVPSVSAPKGAPVAPAPPEPASKKGVVIIAPSAGEVQAALTAWKVAWESRDVATYMMFYHPNFPDRDVFSRQKNGVMVRAKNIRIDVQELKVTVEAQKTRAVFLQHYRSDTYESKDIKTQIWVAGPDGPKILEEFTRAKRGSEGE
jgi:hypothetical protein